MLDPRSLTCRTRVRGVGRHLHRCVRQPNPSSNGFGHPPRDLDGAFDAEEHIVKLVFGVVLLRPLGSKHLKRKVGSVAGWSDAELTWSPIAFWRPRGVRSCRGVANIPSRLADREVIASSKASSGAWGIYTRPAVGEVICSKSLRLSFRNGRDGEALTQVTVEMKTSCIQPVPGYRQSPRDRILKHAQRVLIKLVQRLPPDE